MSLKPIVNIVNTCHTTTTSLQMREPVSVLSSTMDVKQLEQKVNELSSIVEKQSILISKTGQQLVEIQVKSVKDKMSNLDVKQPDLSDYVTNEDIVQLVGELQTQLDYLEDRSINRLVNSKLKTDDQEIAPISNKDGDLSDLLPKTVGDFKKLAHEDIIKLGEFYELVLPNEDNLNKLLEDNNLKSLEEAYGKLDQSSNLSMAPEEVELLKKDLQKYLGLVDLQ